MLHIFLQNGRTGSWNLFFLNFSITGVYFEIFVYLICFSWDVPLLDTEFEVITLAQFDRHSLFAEASTQYSEEFGHEKYYFSKTLNASNNIF